MQSQHTHLAQQLIDILGAQQVINDQEALRFYSSDVYMEGVEAAIVIRPLDRESLRAAVKLISTLGFSMTARGGGMSYTGGYIPDNENTVVIDMAALNKIVEVNEEDMFITVEAGVTWKQIYEELTPRGLRLPFFGTFSGSRATVGGGMSNGALFMATARYGTAAEIVLGLEVFGAEGRLIRTGQAAFNHGRPFYRTYGPDLTGLFIHDAGVLGIKTLVTMRLIEAPRYTDYASFVFEKMPDTVKALSTIARSDAAEELYVFDPETTRRNLTAGSMKQDLKRLGGVIRGQSNIIAGLREGLKMITAGRNFIADDVFSIHLVCAGRSKEAVHRDMAICQELATSGGGIEIANTIPKAARSNLFEPLNGILGADGERWAALNAKIAHSDALRLIESTEQLLNEYQDQMKLHGISISYLYLAISNHAFSFEPVLRWYDSWLPLHKSTPEPDYLAKMTEPDANPKARALVDEIRGRIVTLFAEFGAASNQIGKTYRYLDSLNQESASLLRSLKKELDPKGLMNPGALGQF